MDWSQKELEEIFVRKDVYKSEATDFERRILRMENLLEWFQRLIIAQGIVLIVSLIILFAQRLS